MSEHYEDWMEGEGGGREEGGGRGSEAGESLVVVDFTADW